MKPHNNPAVEKRFIISILVTVVILVAEVIGGLWTGSLALLSDSAHVFMDIFALGLSFLALRLSALPSDDRHTYGYHRLEVIAALVNGISLVAIAVGIWWEAFQRWNNPQPIRSLEMLLIAAIGLVANLVVAFVLGGSTHTHQHIEGEEHDHNHVQDINVHSAFLHVIGDAVSSVGVIIAALIVWRTGWEWADPLMSVLIGVLIVVSALRVLRSSLHILIEGVPEGMNIHHIAELMQSTPAVLQVHDLHVWSICSGHIALSAHVRVQEENRPAGQVMMDLRERLHSEYGIDHTTIQIENSEMDCEQC
jgi:cobalt-zinc-cadmium efflux system protein